MAAATVTPTTSRDFRAALSREEIASLLEMRDARSWLSMGLNWGIVFGAMTLVAVWPNLLTILREPPTQCGATSIPTAPTI